jgi:hypothetical protein
LLKSSAVSSCVLMTLTSIVSPSVLVNKLDSSPWMNPISSGNCNMHDFPHKKLLDASIKLMVWLELRQPARRARYSGCITLQFDAFFFSLHMFVRLGMLAWPKKRPSMLHAPLLCRFGFCVKAKKKRIMHSNEFMGSCLVVCPTSNRDSWSKVK